MEGRRRHRRDAAGLEKARCGVEGLVRPEVSSDGAQVRGIDMPTRQLGWGRTLRSETPIILVLVLVLVLEVGNPHPGPTPALSRRTGEGGSSAAFLADESL